MPWWGDLLVALALVTAITGTIVPVLPGALLAGGALLVWAWVEGGAIAWTVFAVAGIVLVAGRCSAT